MYELIIITIDSKIFLPVTFIFKELRIFVDNNRVTSIDKIPKAQMEKPILK